MKRLLLLLVLFFQFTFFVFCQRAIRRAQVDTIINKQDTFEGRYFSIVLSNNDTIPILLKLGPTSQVGNNDTLKLARTYPCNNPVVGEYYDLHNLTSWESSCVNWYTLQLIKPNESIRFIANLKDFDKSAKSRLYYSYTSEIKSIDQELDLYANKKKIYIQKEYRNFKTDYVIVEKSMSDNRLEINLKIQPQSTPITLIN